MSTEKSLLTYEDISASMKRDTKMEGLQIPIGIALNGSIRMAELEIYKSSSHMLLCGMVGSGEMNALQFVLRGLLDLYKREIGISCISGNAEGIATVRRILHNAKSAPSTYLMMECGTVEALDNALHSVLGLAEVKNDRYSPEIIILDDIDSVLRTHPGRFHNALAALTYCAPRRNIHILYNVQVGMDILGALPMNPIEFGLVCATRISQESSMQLFGSTIASKEGGTRKYGDITYKYKDTVERITVPFCPYH